MKFSINMKLKNQDALRTEAKKRMQKILFSSMLKMEEIAKRKAPVDTGNLKNKIHITPSEFGANKYTLSDGTSYGVYMEYGTKPHWVPIAPLKEWSRRVLGEEDAAYAVRNKIKEYGVNAQPFFRPALHEVKRVWLPRYKNMDFGKP